MGRPVIHSAKKGLRKTTISTEGRIRDVEQIRLATLPPLSSLASTDALEQSRHSLAGRVGNNPGSLASLWDTNEGAWKNIPFRIVPDTGKAPENADKSVPDEIPDVFDDDGLRAQFFNETGVFVPEPASVSIEAVIDTPGRASDRNVLAREPAADDIDSNSISGKSIGCEGSDIFILPYVGPMFGENLAAERINFAKGNRLKAASALKPKAKAAYAAEKIENAEFRHCPVLTYSCFGGSGCGHCRIRRSSGIMMSVGRKAATCFIKKAVPFSAHWSRVDRAQVRSKGRSFH